MAEGSGSYEGLAPPLYGEYEQFQQTAATDMVTLTGSTGTMTGDFIVMQNSTGAELAYIDANGKATFVGGLAASSSLTGTQATLVVSATTMAGGLTVSVTSTGALQALGTTEHNVNGIVIAPSSKAIMNCALYYAGGSTTTVNTAISLLGVAGANSGPSYFLALPGSGSDIYVGAHSGDHSFVDASLTVNTFTCDHPFIGIKCLSGSQTFYLLGVHATGIT